ncbi:MAG: hypothetical protein LBP79_07525, partial [Clostridiales bacterium]|nr:hypothetical protein [Clostridiales bacterium]
MANDKQRQEMAELAELCKPTVEISSDGYGGNIYSILAKVRTAMRKRRMLQAYSDLYFDVTNNN